MDFVDVWTMKDWTADVAYAVAIEAVRRGGRETALVQWYVPDFDGDFDALVEANSWDDQHAVVAVITWSDDVGFSRQLDAHARRVARKQAPDPDHYGN